MQLVIWLVYHVCSCCNGIWHTSVLFTASIWLVGACKSWSVRDWPETILDRCDPHQIRPPTIASKMVARRRKHELRIPALPLPSHPGYPGYPEPVKYAHLPMSRYQAWLRAHVIGDKVSSHYTRPCGPSIVERLVWLPVTLLSWDDKFVAGWWTSL